jgi:hypothetical protein
MRSKKAYVISDMSKAATSFSFSGTETAEWNGCRIWLLS